MTSGARLVKIPAILLVSLLCRLVKLVPITTTDLPLACASSARKHASRMMKCVAPAWRATASSRSATSASSCHRCVAWAISRADARCSRNGSLVVRRLLDFVSRHGYAPFGWWRIVVGVAGLVALMVVG